MRTSLCAAFVIICKKLKSIAAAVAGCMAESSGYLAAAGVGVKIRLNIFRTFSDSPFPRLVEAHVWNSKDQCCSHSRQFHSR